MQIQSILIIIIATAILSVVLGMTVTMEDKFKRVMIYIFVIFTWIFVVITIDLYMTIAKMRQDMATYMTCNSVQNVTY